MERFKQCRGVERAGELSANDELGDPEHAGGPRYPGKNRKRRSRAAALRLRQGQRQALDRQSARHDDRRGDHRITGVGRRSAPRTGFPRREAGEP